MAVTPEPLEGMRPVVLPRGLGWLHVPSRPRSIGVVLCPALGREGRWSYRTMRQLADRLAAEGMPTLRFDYPGTGNAPDPAGNEDALAAWRQSIHDAIDWLRTQTGLEQVALCGLRFGALLAAEIATSRSDIAAVAMLSPIASGRVCARELRMASFGGEGDDGPLDGIEADGMLLSNETLTNLASLDLRSNCKAPARHVLILDDGPRAATLASHFDGLGAHATLLPFPEYSAMMRVATSNQVPVAAIDRVALWFSTFTATPRLRALPERTTVNIPGATERIVQFGPDHRLVGTLCEPDDGRRPAHAVLITNTGGDSRSGIARFGVRLAHKLAASGIASLRFDFAGLGDSTLPDDSDGHLYQIDRTADIRAALESLAAAGYRHVGGIGLCTGAYHLLHAAFAGIQLDSLALLNPVTFRWQTGDILDVPQRALGHAVEMAPQSRWDGAATAISGVLHHGTNLMVLLGLGDPGIAALEASFGPDGAALAAQPGATVRFESGIDHTLSRRIMQDQVSRSVIAFLTAETVLARA